MRFRAKMLESFSMKNLSIVGGVLAKLSKSTIIKIDERTMSLMIYDDNSSPKQTMVWCILQVHQFFNEYHVEGPTEVNEIYLDVPTEMLSSSLSLLKQGSNNARSVKIKLTDKMSPCLSVEIDLVSEYSSSRLCVHDIPVRIIPRCEWSQYTNPFDNDSELVLEVSSLKKVRSVLDSMKKFCQFINICAHNEGSLSFEAMSQTASVKTIFRNLKVIKFSEQEAESISARVDVKKLYQLLLCEQLSPQHARCEIISDSLLHFQVLLDSLTFHFYLPSTEE